MLDVNEFSFNNLDNVYYAATVIDNNDPDKEGKIKIRVTALHDDVKDSELPWALPASNTNLFDIPLKSKLVWVEFQQGNIYEPVYLGYTVSKGHFAGIVAENYPDTRGLFDGKNWITMNRVTGKIEIHNERHSIVFENNELRVTANDTIKIVSNGVTHMTASELDIHNNVVIDGNTNIKMNLDVDGNTNIDGTLHVDGATTLDSTLQIDGMTTASGGVTTTSLVASSTVTAAALKATNAFTGTFKDNDNNTIFVSDGIVMSKF